MSTEKAKLWQVEVPCPVLPSATQHQAPSALIYHLHFPELTPCAWEAGVMVGEPEHDPQGGQRAFFKGKWDQAASSPAG